MASMFILSCIQILFNSSNSTGILFVSHTSQTFPIILFVCAAFSAINSHNSKAHFAKGFFYLFSSSCLQQSKRQEGKQTTLQRTSHVNDFFDADIWDAVAAVVN